MGGALYNYGNKVASVINCNILGNVANIAGGVANKGILTIENSKINYNVANNEVGGIYNDHILTIKDSEIKNNISYGADSFSSIINEYPSNKYPSAGIYSFFSDEEEEEIITNNEYVRTSVTLKGKVVVTDNISLVEQGKFISANFIVACNIDVDVKELTSGSNIGVTKLTATEPDVVGGDIPILGTVVTSCDESDLGYFYADDDNKIVYYNNGTIELAQAANVEFVSNGGNEIDSKKVRLNTSVEAPLAPTKEGYTFAGWYKEEALNNAWNFSEDVVTEDTALYAKWNINSYTVSFNSNGGSNVTTATINYNNNLTNPTAPTKDGYTFGGWYKDEALKNAWNFNEDVVTSSTTLYAKWDINSYTVTFNSNGGSNVASATINYNNNLNTPTAPTKDGYTFGGWYKDEALTYAWNFSEDIITEDTTLYAKWTENKIDNPVIEDDKEEDEGLSIGLIILIIVSIIFGLLLIYLVIYLFVYKKKELNNKFFKTIYSWLDKALESKKELK